LRFQQIKAIFLERYVQTAAVTKITLNQYGPGYLAENIQTYIQECGRINRKLRTGARGLTCYDIDVKINN